MHKFTLAIYVILLYIVLRINAACYFSGDMRIDRNLYNNFITYFKWRKLK